MRRSLPSQVGATAGGNRKGGEGMEGKGGRGREGKGGEGRQVRGDGREWDWTLFTVSDLVCNL